jgi:hypothetical protein
MVYHEITAGWSSWGRTGSAQSITPRASLAVTRCLVNFSRMNGSLGIAVAAAEFAASVPHFGVFSSFRILALISALLSRSTSFSALR